MRGGIDWGVDRYLPGPGTEEIIKRCVRVSACITKEIRLTGNRVEEVAKKRGISMAQVALAWMLTKDRTSMLVFQIV
jgi:aryl-alcohol dehydrogenase-like predicted oxidoreductase